MSSTYSSIKLIEGGYGASGGELVRLVLSRAHKHNAVDEVMLGEIREALRVLGKKEGLRVLVIEGEGKSFCSGRDLALMERHTQGSRADKIAETTKFADLLEDLDSFSCAVISRVHGDVYAGGVGIISVSDVVIGKRGIKIGITEGRLGLIGGSMGKYVVRRIGEGNSRRLFMVGINIGIEEGQRMGLVSEIAGSEEELDVMVSREVGMILSCASDAVRASKELCCRLHRGEIEGDVKTWTAELLADIWESEEAKSRLQKFFAKDR